MKPNRNRIPLPDALRVKSAELWLKLGQPAEALKELRTLSEAARAHPWASTVARAALQTYEALRAPSLNAELAAEP